MNVKISKSELSEMVSRSVKKALTEWQDPDDISEPFVAHGAYTVSNAGGYEVMLSNDGEYARVRDAFGSDNPRTSGWLPIEYVPNEDAEDDDYTPVIDPDGYNIPLNQVMRINQRNESKQPTKVKVKLSELKEIIKKIIKEETENKRRYVTTT